MTQGQNGRAIGVMCLGILGLVMSDTAANELVDRYEALQIMFVRSCIALPLVMAIVVRAEGWGALRSKRPSIHLLRAILTLGATYTFFTSLRTLPLAGSTALALTAPLFVTALSVPLLGEKVGRLRWGALVVGFGGALVIVQPGADTLQPAALLALGTALCYALVMIAARWIHEGDSLRTVMFYLTLLPLVLSSWTLLLDWPVMTLADLTLFAAMAICGTFGITLITQAFRMAPAAIVAPFDYTALIWASFTGWLFFDELPMAATYFGAGIIVAAGLFVIWREAKLAQR
ncbi:Threonine/homoserine efflux transporter RhtA [Monaibacterium marinum]|uniref:Threonine/homoserine efflux transporter RhtA n=1 Tax=Pontivivens marinum TaxID=1690039 RepID=A0A2C9CT14_9RHOB|nr:DMT family transporter [Monaibacterium marinum]SOH94464.1 Threonine/homoserine efflux transporter RhtA [Monaibacterium marinum]